ncbi:MAG: hypothetical protein [Wendovervirus sonii]|uniref:Cyclic nucleotide-binding domain-containing protein n=1 Tax=phage Lak_Megaphage_Sonny TaxID=3109229 RepID=A0ABZ0Z3N7_9CAUD|nr:MAG: hypothetical protein [phage Lak_Megaphage_Sonny]
MKYEVINDFLYIIDSIKENEPAITYIFKKGEIYQFSPFHGKNAKEGDMMSEHTLHTICSTGQVELSMLVLDQETFKQYFKNINSNEGNC